MPAPDDDRETPQLPAEFVAAHGWLFPSLHSYQWFVRKNLAELLTGGALVRPTGRVLVVPKNFIRVAMEVGARRAQAAARPRAVGQ